MVQDYREVAHGEQKRNQNHTRRFAGLGQAPYSGDCIDLFGRFDSPARNARVLRVRRLPGTADIRELRGVGSRCGRYLSGTGVGLVAWGRDGRRRFPGVHREPDVGVAGTTFLGAVHGAAGPLLSRRRGDLLGRRRVRAYQAEREHVYIQLDCRSKPGRKVSRASSIQPGSLPSRNGNWQPGFVSGTRRAK
jgi:hypothetical protein